MARERRAAAACEFFAVRTVTVCARGSALVALVQTPRRVA
jgi:hypothetical protein